MTTGQDNAFATPAPDPGPKPNPVQRIIGVLFSPDATMASVAKRPDWVLPLVLLLVTSLIAGIVVAQHVDFGAAVRESMEQNNKNMPPEQAEKGIKIATAIGKVLTYLAPVLSLIGLLIIAGVLLLVFRMFGGEGDFKQAFSVTCYASIPSIIKSVVTLIILIAKGGIIPVTALATLVRSNLGFLADMKTNPLAFAFYSAFDIFSVWFLVLLVMGFSYLSGLSKVKSAVIIVSLWFCVLLVKLIGPALQTMRAK